MKLNWTKLLATASLGLVLLVTFPTMQGCFGSQARTHTGVPALQMGGTGVVADARNGAHLLDGPQREAALVEINIFAEAIEGNRDDITHRALPRWATVRALALAGIHERRDQGDIGPGVAASLEERLIQFEIVLLQVAAPR